MKTTTIMLILKNQTIKMNGVNNEAEIPTGFTDTMLTPTHFLEDNERQHILNVARAEGNRPLSVFRDEYSEELAYRRIFLGQPQQETKQRKVTVNYSAILCNRTYL